MKAAFGSAWLSLVLAMPGMALADDPGSITTDSFRCGEDIVQLGDSQASIVQKCGAPTTQFQDHWFYQRDTEQFSLKLYFEADGTLAQIVEVPAK